MCLLGNPERTGLCVILLPLATMESCVPSPLANMWCLAQGMLPPSNAPHSVSRVASPAQTPTDNSRRLPMIKTRSDDVHEAFAELTQMSQVAKGAQMSQGAKGAQMSQGAQGYQTSQGAQGYQMSQGAQGAQLGGVSQVEQKDTDDLPALCRALVNAFLADMQHPGAPVGSMRTVPRDDPDLILNAPQFTAHSSFQIMYGTLMGKFSELVDRRENLCSLLVQNFLYYGFWFSRQQTILSLSESRLVVSSLGSTGR